MDADLFLADLERKPATLRALADTLRQADPWAFLTAAPERIVLLGMGSSAYAAGVAAARLRARGIVAVSELASTDLLPTWPGALVVATSASGRSKETLAALSSLVEPPLAEPPLAEAPVVEPPLAEAPVVEPPVVEVRASAASEPRDARTHPPRSTTVALTNDPDSPVAARCDHVVAMLAGHEEGGVACRSYAHTLALLLALEARLTGTPLAVLADVVDKAADATAYLLHTRDDWLPRVTDLLAGPDGTHLVAPARRLGSAQQGALMLREGPRHAAVGCESGDWAHVDVYLTKNTDYRLLAFAGSAWDDGIHEWTGPRRTTVVAVGGDFPGATAMLRYPHDDVDDVRLLAETLVPELVAAELWLDGA